MGWTDKGIEGGKQGVRLVTHARGCRCLVCMPMGGSGEDWAGQMGQLVHMALRWGRASGAERRVLGIGLRQALLDVYGEEVPMEYAEIVTEIEGELMQAEARSEISDKRAELFPDDFWERWMEKTRGEIERNCFNTVLQAQEQHRNEIAIWAYRDGKESGGWSPDRGAVAERDGAVDVGAGWHRDYEQRIRDMWGRMVAGWERAGVVEDGYWRGWAEAVEEICVIVGDADEEIERMRGEIKLLKGRGARDGMEDVSVVGRLGMLRGEND